MLGASFAQHAGMAISKEFANQEKGKGVTVKCGAEGGGRPNSNAQADGIPSR